GFISSPFNPPFNRSEPHTIKPCDFTPRSTLPNRRDQSTASIRPRTFLSILPPQQRFCRTLNKAITMATVPHLVTHRRSEGCDTYPINAEAGSNGSNGSILRAASGQAKLTTNGTSRSIAALRSSRLRVYPC